MFLECFKAEFPQVDCVESPGWICLHVSTSLYLSVLTFLYSHFEQLSDLTIVDRLTYGQASWNTKNPTHQGFSRAQLPIDLAQAQADGRFDAIIHLLSYTLNIRLRLHCQIDRSLSLPSLTSFWPSANWYEREAFDLFGIAFENHPDLRRLLTDYGFTGYPFRKDFPMVGYDQLIYDGATEQCRLEPVNITQRIITPRVIRGGPSL